MKLMILYEKDIRRVVTEEEAIEEIEKAFAAYAQGKAVVPGIISLNIPGKNGDIHIKGAHIKGSEFFAFKAASGFYDNPKKGLPVSSGMMLLFDAETGFPISLLFDNAYLTQLRTGAAGAVAAKYLAPKKIEQVGIIGSGEQGRFQLRALNKVRAFSRVKIWGVPPESIEQYIKDMQPFIKAKIEGARDVKGAVEESDIIITATPSKKPLVKAEWVKPGAHITAVGSDEPEKQELQASVLGKANKVVADSLQQCVERGEIHHAVAEKILKPEEVHAELGEVVTGKKSGRENDSEITICDLTGVGIQDVAIASLTYKKALEKGVGNFLEI
jgi:ectoine utilization protein EutC